MLSQKLASQKRTGAPSIRFRKEFGCTAVANWFQVPGQSVMTVSQYAESIYFCVEPDQIAQQGMPVQDPHMF